MTNPIEADRSKGYASELNPGETRTIKAGEKLITIIRTERPYIFDLRDAYNNARRRWDVVWIVDHAGTLRLVDDDDVSRANRRRQERKIEEERAEFKRLNRPKQEATDVGR